MKKPDYIDLFLDYLDGTLDKELADDIKSTLPNDPVLNTTVEGLAELYEEHGRDREALRQYFKDTEEEITNNLIKKGYGEKSRRKPIRLNIILLLILGIGLIILSLWFGNNRNFTKKTKENRTSVIDTLENPTDSNFIEGEDDKEGINKDEPPSNLQNNSKPSKIDKTSVPKKSKSSKPIAFGGSGSYEKLPHIESMIATNFRNKKNQVLQDTIVRDTFFTATQNFEVRKTFNIAEQYLSDKPILYFFNFDTEDRKMKYKFTEEKYVFKENLPLGLYYWSINVDGVNPVYGSILIQKK